MTSQVSIINIGLIALGEPSIISIDDATKPARTMKALYEPMRDAELRKNRWSFAMKRVSLSALSSAPDWGYDYQYQLPSDCLRLDMIKDSYVVPNLDNYRQQEDLHYTVEGRRILTNEAAPLSIRHIYRVTDTNEFDALFAVALGKRLAFEACETITQSSQKKQIIMQEYTMALRDAVKVGAIEKPPVPLPDDSWMMGRL